LGEIQGFGSFRDGFPLAATGRVGGGGRLRYLLAPMDRSSPAADMLPPGPRRALAIWLFVVAGSVGAMTVIGGITRLTESGLSMVEWRPLIGWLPPASHEEWMRVFELYRATPEYRHVNAGMSLADFQEIFWWEFIHRVWGRLIGVVYALPLLVFCLKGWIKGPLRGRMLLLLALGGLQGFIGWWMVASGLVDRPDVSHYRLAVHLAMAFAIAALLVWTALDLVARRPAPAPAALRRHAWAVVGAVGFVVVLGAFVAGTNAGLIYNTFPLMGGGIVPPDLLFLDPWWLNPLENIAAIQFQHRWVAILTVALILWLWARTRGAAVDRRPANMLAAVALLQACLGVATLLTLVWIPLAALHQAVALLLLLTAVWTAWSFRGQAPPP